MALNTCYLLATSTVDFFGVSAQLFWLVAMIIFIVVEAVSVGLLTIWFAFGALVALIASYFQLSFMVQVAIFAITSLLLLFYTRPIIKKFITPRSVKTNAESLIGKKAVVIKEITEHAYGQVKVGAQVWTAKATTQETINKDSEVIIDAIEGVKLIVKKQH